MRILITEGEQKQTLAAVRSLAREDNVEIFVSSHYKYAVTFFSKYGTEKIISPHPRESDEFLSFLTATVKKYNIDVLMPIGYLSTRLVSLHSDVLRPLVKFKVADWDAMKIASNKDETLRFASEIGIPSPMKFENFSEITKFPVVVKGKFESGQVSYVRSESELASLDESENVVQEYVKGEGYGFYALYDSGKLKAFFMHKRLREYPATGGSSTKCVGFYDEELMNSGTKLLDALNWNGVAMVEYKLDKSDGKYKLMEINPKFWGSLDLSICSGVPFPNLLYHACIGKDVNYNKLYKRGVKFRWLFPDEVLHVIDSPKSFFQVLGDVFNPAVKSNFSIRDIKPFFVQIYETYYILKQGIRNKNLKKKHGTPEVE